ncbi:MAG: hypothetical protein ACI82N_001404 [Maricaulis sp.]|jgi:hypothetical protein
MVRLSVLAPAALLLLTACASHDGPSPRGRGGMQDGGPGGAGGFNMAVRLVDQGEYEQALPILRCVAGQGTGFEIAQYLAGYSAMRLSIADTTPSILRDELRVEGLDRLTMAAQAGWPTAQAELATQFAETASEDAPVQAAYWAAVYRHNARDRTYGLDRLDDGIEAQITDRIDPVRAAEIEQIAANFTVQPMSAVPASPACAPYLGSPRGAPGAGRRPPPGGGRGGPPPGGGRGGGRPGGSTQS